MRRIGVLMNLAANDASPIRPRTPRRPGRATAGPPLAFGLSTGSRNPYHSAGSGSSWGCRLKSLFRGTPGLAEISADRAKSRALHDKGGSHG